LPWEIEESIVTPLASLAAVEFFRRKNDQENLRRSVAAVAEERQLSRELTELAREAERLFSLEPPESAKDKVLSLMTAYPTYRRQFERQIEGQNPSTVLEAKLSHDLAYFGYFDAIAALAESAPELKTLIGDLKELGPTVATVEYHLHRLRVKYDANRG
jgi:hypothetical protein